MDRTFGGQVSEFEQTMILISGRLIHRSVKKMPEILSISSKSVRTKHDNRKILVSATYWAIQQGSSIKLVPAGCVSLGRRTGCPQYRGAPGTGLQHNRA